MAAPTAQAATGRRQASVAAGVEQPRQVGRVQRAPLARLQPTQLQPADPRPVQCQHVVAGGGVTWMVAPTVQLDLSANVGLTTDSTDLQAGFGISMFFP